MLDFESLNGFYIDLTTRAMVLLELESVLSNEEDRESLIQESSIHELRDFILEYYTSYYDYVFCRKPNFYLVVDEELTTEKEIL